MNLDRYENMNVYGWQRELLAISDVIDKFYSKGYPANATSYFGLRGEPLAEGEFDVFEQRLLIRREYKKQFTYLAHSITKIPEFKDLNLSLEKISMDDFNGYFISYSPVIIRLTGKHTKLTINFSTMVQIEKRDYIDDVSNLKNAASSNPHSFIGTSMKLSTYDLIPQSMERILHVVCDIPENSRYYTISSRTEMFQNSTLAHQIASTNGIMTNEATIEDLHLIELLLDEHYRSNKTT